MRYKVNCTASEQGPLDPDDWHDSIGDTHTSAAIAFLRRHTGLRPKIVWVARDERNNLHRNGAPICVLKLRLEWEPRAQA